MRAERGFSQADVARALGISPGQLGNIESPRRNHKYTLKQIYTLSKLFNVELADIFNVSDADINSIIEKIIKYQDD
jgi:transcriptional regulator with XRE-family HTH domain